MATLPSLTPADSADAAPDIPADAVEIATIGGAWGVKGAFKVHPYAVDPQALFSSRRWYLRGAQAGAPGVRSPPGLLRITQAREQGAFVVATAQEVADRDAAQALHGARVFVSRASFPSPAIDEYYWIDLIGLSVINRQGEMLGEVVDLLDTGAHSVLRVQVTAGDATAPASAAEERLIPFVAAYVDQVDLEARRITVDWGLDY